MKRLHLLALLSFTAALVLGTGPPGASAAAGDELLYNPGLEASAGGVPAYWTGSAWGTNTPLFTYVSGDAHGGTHSVRVDLASYTDGDAKWVPELVPVTAGQYYTFSDWYKSDTTSAISVYYEKATDPADGGTWANLFSGIAPASQWTQYTTGFTMPAGAVRAYFVHFIARNGYLQTDDYSMRQADSPPGFSHPLISLTFDDGSQGFYDRALPLLDERGFKTTQYIPTQGLTNGDTFMMTPQEIRALSQSGHEIGSHSVTHPDLTTVSDDQLKTELVDSKAQLEAIVNKPVLDFGYPFGTYDARVIQAEKDAGYRSGRSVEEGYNTPLDTEPFDIRVQNMLSTTTLDTFKPWVDYAKSHDYWLTIVYHEVVPDGTPACVNEATDPDPCLGAYDTTVSQFTQQLAYIADSGLGSDVMTVQQALGYTTNHAPVAGSVKISPAGARTDSVLTAEPQGFSDADGESPAYHYQWYVGGHAVSGATGSSFDLAPAGHGDRGDQVSVTVYATDGHEATSATVNDSMTVADTPPSRGQVALGPAAPVLGSTLAAAPSGFSDADGDALRFEYAWYLGSRQLAASGDRLTLTQGQPGDVIRVEVRAFDDSGLASEAATASVVLGNSSPNLVPDKIAPAIAIASPKRGTYRVGSRLTVKFSCSDASGIASYKATLSHGKKKWTVRKGSKVRLSAKGTWVLRVSATDSRGNTRTASVTFRVR